MDEKTQTLWERLTRYQLDPQNVALPFSKRLAQENGWSEHYTQRVTEEYKRFLLLAVVVNHPICPSTHIDTAWHLHLTYTRSYWNDLCEQVLKQPLHHEPTRGENKEYNKYSTWYGSTVSAYVKTFGEKPPTDIWPDPSSQFPSNDNLDIPLFLRPLFSSQQRARLTATFVIIIVFVTLIFMSLAESLGHWPSFYELWTTPLHFLEQWIRADPAFSAVVALAGACVTWILISAWKSWRARHLESQGRASCSHGLCGGGCGDFDC
ncbi:glycine-rich domain-containing protein [Nitrospira sp. M1]